MYIKDLRTDLHCNRFDFDFVWHGFGASRTCWLGPASISGFAAWLFNTQFSDNHFASFVILDLICSGLASATIGKPQKRRTEGGKRSAKRRWCRRSEVRDVRPRLGRLPPNDCFRGPWSCPRQDGHRGHQDGDSHFKRVTFKVRPSR